jgi:hypothetical protein
MWLGWMVRNRQISTCCEIALPAAAMLVLLALRFAVNIPDSSMCVNRFVLDSFGLLCSISSAFCL